MTSDQSVLKTKEVVPEVKAVLAQTICIDSVGHHQVLIFACGVFSLLVFHF